MASVTPTAPTKSNRLGIIICLALVYLVWGSTYYAISIAIKTMPPLLMTSVRFFIAGSALYITMRLLKVPRPTLRQWAQAGLVGALLLGGGNGTVTYVELQTPSSIAAVLVALVPMWMVMLNGLIPGGARPTGRIIAGVAIGFAGVALLALRGGVGGGGLHPSALLLVISTFLWAAGSIYAGRADMPKSPLMSTAVEMLVGAMTLLVGGLVTGEASAVNINAISGQSIAGLVYLILVGSLVGYSSYTWLLKNAPPALVSTYAYVNPVVAMILGVVLGGDKLTSIEVAAAAIIIASVVLITLPGSAARARMRARRASRPAVEAPAEAEVPLAVISEV
ncbi:MAG TPA: EamA family transporter [Ktedonobacterales bacterium]